VEVAGVLILPGLPHSSVVFALWLVPMFYVVFLGVFYNVSFYEFRFFFKKFFFWDGKIIFFFDLRKKFPPSCGSLHPWWPPFLLLCSHRLLRCSGCLFFTNLLLPMFPLFTQLWVGSVGPALLI